MASPTPPSSGASTLEEIRLRREKQAQDLALRQNFQLPQTMAMPKWAETMDRCVRAAEADQGEATVGARWLKALKPATGDDDVAGSRWLSKLNEEAPLPPSA